MPRGVDCPERGVTNFTLHDDEPLMDWHLNDSEVVVEAHLRSKFQAWRLFVWEGEEEAACRKEPPSSWERLVQEEARQSSWFEPVVALSLRSCEQ